MAIFGIGGFGHLAQQYAQIFGGETIAADVFRLHAAGRTRVFSEPRRLEDINQAIQGVLASRVPARLALIP